MVFRKPYAFLIKNFRLMHIILTICCVYLITKTSALISFLSDYMNSSDLVIGQKIVSNLYSPWMFIVPVLMLIFFIILLAVMSVKEKPKTFYVINILVYVAIFGILIYGQGVLKSMEKEIVSPQTIHSLYDLLIYALIFQIFTSVIAAIRGLGFDIRKFDFARDLQSLDISDEDNEEFEVAINYDFDDTKRKFKSKARHIKYTYLEHKFVINMVIVLLIAFTGYTVYKNTSFSIKKYHLSSLISMNSFSTRFTNAYYVDSDYLGNSLNTNLVVFKVSIKSDSRSVKKFVPSAYELVIGNKVYHHSNNFNNAFKDLGVVYANQDLSTTDYKDYLLVYDVGKTSLKDQKLKISNVVGQNYVYLTFNPIKFNGKNETKEFNIGDTVKLEDNILANTSFKINSASIAEKYVLDYNYCLNNGECINSKEYIRPDYYNTHDDKTLIRLDYEYSSDTINSFYKLISLYGSIEYKIGDEVKVQRGGFKNIKSKRIAEDGICNIEVLKEIESASSVTLVLNIRNSEYRYILK